MKVLQTGGYRPTVNIIGLWITQEIRRNFASQGRDYSFVQMAELASKEKPLQSFHLPGRSQCEPGDYITKIREYCKQTGQPVPMSRRSFGAVYFRESGIEVSPGI